MIAKPFCRWVGGKTRLLPQLMRYVPASIDTYFEPFLGGGAMFFALASEEPRRFKRAVLSDANEELINCYVQVRDHVETVLGTLRGEETTRERFQQVAKMHSVYMGKISRAARFIYLNRVGFNGLWRVNASGEYNVPFGRRADGKPIEACPPEYAENLRACSRALQGVEINCSPWELALETTGERCDFAFLDPPYLPAKEGSFTAYTSSGFGVREHAALARWSMITRTPHVLCNADTPVSRDLYRGMKSTKVSARRSVSGKARGRKPARELLVIGGAA